MPETVEALKDMFDRVFDSEEYKDRRTRWQRYMREYLGEWWGPGDDSDSQVAFNMLFSTIETNAPLLTDNKPMWTVLARWPHHQKLADNLTKASRALWDKLDMDMKNLQAVKDSQLFGKAIYKLYYSPDEDEICVDVIDPATFVVAPGTMDLWKASWCGEKSRMPIEWVHRSYPDKAEEVKSDRSDDADDGIQDRDVIEGDDEFVTVYEIWMRDDTTMEVELGEDEDGKKLTEEQLAYPDGRIVTFTKDSILLDDRPSPFSHGKPPYVDLADYPIPHRFWAQGEADQIENMVREHNLRLRHVVDTARKYDKKNFILSEDAGITVAKFKEALRTGDNVLLAKGDFHKDMFVEVPTPHLDTATLNLLDLLPRYVEEITGVTDVTKGVVGKKSRQSASEVSILIESSYTRTRQRVRNLEWSIKRILTLILELMQQYYVEPRPFQTKKDDQVEFGYFSNDAEFSMNQFRPDVPDIPDEELSPEHRKEVEDYRTLFQEFIDKDEIHIDFELQIDTNSTLPLDKQALANLAVRLAEMKVIPEEALLEILRFPNKDRYVAMMEERRQQEMQSKQGGPPQGGPPQGAPPPSGQPSGPPPNQQGGNEDG